jgi:hypothetical protein
MPWAYRLPGRAAAVCDDGGEAGAGGRLGQLLESVGPALLE